MIEFLLKGLLRDKSRSLLPVVVVSLGVFLSVLFSGYIKGAIGGMIDHSAKFETGHLKVVTREYKKNITQKPMDLALLGTDKLLADLHRQFPEINWMQRIQFGGILDVPDEEGGTKAQGIASGMGIDLSEDSKDIERLNIQTSLIRGKMPSKRYEMLMGKGLIERLGLQLGEEVTYFGSTIDGSMAFQNFTVVGVLDFGSVVLDNKTFMVNLPDAQTILDMENGAAEIVGYLPNDIYDDLQTQQIRDAFNVKYADDKDIFAPTMLALRDQNGMDAIIDMADGYASLITVMFVIAMSIVLWNTGLLGGLRRYQEFGIRIAMGESKMNIYKTLLMESVLVGIIGSIIGTVIGLAITFYLQHVGIDISKFLQNSNVMMSDVIRAQFTVEQLYIGFIPGVFATLFGALLSGRGIFKRQTSELFNELGV